MNDIQILEKCMEFGRNLKFFRNKFLGLLPVINEKRLYENRGFSSIFTFAFQVGGVSEQQVKAVLSLYFRFRNLSALKSLLINGTVSANKLLKVVSIACKENEEELCSLVLKLPYKALETLLRDYKLSMRASDTSESASANSNPAIQNPSGFPFFSTPGSGLYNQHSSSKTQNTSFLPKAPICHSLATSYCPNSSNYSGIPSPQSFFLPGTENTPSHLSLPKTSPYLAPHSSHNPTSSLPLPSQSLQTVKKDSRVNSSAPIFPQEKANFDPKFLRAQKVFSALNEEVLSRLNILLEKGFDLNEILTTLLDEREQQIEEKKAEISQKSANKVMPSRYIPASVRQIVREEKGTNCSFPNCNRKAVTLHHTNRFALTKRHDPNFLAPLCKQHHQIAHFIDAKFTKNLEFQTDTS
jgi:hypothetical protein